MKNPHYSIIHQFIVSFVLFCVVFISWKTPVTHAEVTIQTPSAILIESSTGKVIYELNASERKSPASITKIMTLLLTFEAIDAGRADLTDDVITSEYASSMGGSQVFLAQGEVQSLDTMIKCIAVASGNDASVAVAEHIAGSEEAFVAKMNEKAKALGMANTHFEDCCGLSDSDGHYTTAKDVSIMSRELITKYPEVLKYTTIWMEPITHVTPQGTSEFMLSSTNRLLKQYQWATGLKTGSTDKAKYCLAATASKDGMDLIAVVMGAPDPKTRFSDAQTLLTHGYNVSKLFVEEENPNLPLMPVDRGVMEECGLKISVPFRYLDVEGNDLSAVERRLELPEKIVAPVALNQPIGVMKYYLGGKCLGEVPVVAASEIERAKYFDYVKKIFHELLL